MLKILKIVEKYCESIIRLRRKYMNKKEYEANLVKEVTKDFKERQMMRRSFDAAWQLNINFLLGNQNCVISDGEVVEEEKQFIWQEREVYNHIMPLVETRASRLRRVRPSPLVRPYSSSEEDISTAKLSNNILKAVYDEKNLSELINRATMWSEACGTVFYKIVWNKNIGMKIKSNEELYSGDVDISVCSPFEIYPDSNACDSLLEVNSLIHAKAFPVDKIEELWGVKVKGGEIDVFTLDQLAGKGDYGFGFVNYGKCVKKDHAVIIEKYIKPDSVYKEGRLIIVAGDKLLYDDKLPYINESFTRRGFPFVMQCANRLPGVFWGNSVIERCIPVQRAYNAVKNRKSEFLDRLSMGVVAVEDGSVDTDILEEGGLTPGSVIVYRQGSVPPKILDSGHIPTELNNEENKLLNEFSLISGVSDMMKNSYIPSNLASGVALQMLTEQDDARLGVTADEIKSAVKKVCQHILRLYKQFAVGERLIKFSDYSGEIQVQYFNSSDITSDDIIFDTESDISDTPAQRRNTVYELLNSGLFSDENGKLTQTTKRKLIEMIGLSSIEARQDLSELQIANAKKENEEILKKDIVVSEIDDHNIHIEEHTRHALCYEKSKDKLIKHIKEHKSFLEKEKFNLAIQNAVSAE